MDAANAELQRQTVSRQVVKKITAKIVCGGKPDIEELILFLNKPGVDPTAVMPLFNVIGVATDFSTGQSDMGAFLKLLGQFKATNVKTGEIFRSGACILPGSGNDMVYGALRAIPEGQGGGVEFAFNIGIKRDKESATGYVYHVEQVTDLGQTDPLAHLEKLVAPTSNVKQLADATATGTNGKKK